VVVRESALRNLVSQPEITEQTWEDLEDTLLGADFGPDVTDALESSFVRR
jgi:fused signal recognition particle receptor